MTEEQLQAAVEIICAWDEDDHGTYTDLAKKFAVALAAEYARGRAEALTETADAWQWKDWFDMPTDAFRGIAGRMVTANHVTAWLRDRADQATEALKR